MMFGLFLLVGASVMGVFTLSTPGQSQAPPALVLLGLIGVLIIIVAS